MVPRRVVRVAAVGDGIVERSRSNKKRLTCLWWVFLWCVFLSCAWIANGAIVVVAIA